MKRIKIKKKMVVGGGSIRREIKMLQEQFITLMMKDVEKKLKEMWQKSFERVDKLGKYLAWQIKKRREKKRINKTKAGEKERVDQEGIKNKFFNYFEKLYQEQPIKVKYIEKYFEKIKLREYWSLLKYIWTMRLKEKKFQEPLIW